MARSFAATSSQSIDVTSAPSINFGNGDFTVLAWVRFPVASANDSVIISKRAGGFDGDAGWELKFNDGAAGTIRWDVETDVTGRQRAEGTATGITNGNWHLIGGDRTDGTPAQLQIWYDGAVIATKVANTPGTVDTVTPLVVAAAYDTPANTNFLTGEVGPVFATGNLLTLAEHQAMAAGFSPRFLRPLPGFLLELFSRASPEPDIIGGLAGVLQNAPGIVSNPRIVLPRAPDIGQDLWYEFGNATITGQSALSVTPTRGRTASATAAGQSALSTTITRARAGASTTQGQSALVADVSVSVPISATVTGQSAATATMSANVAPEADVLALSSLSATANIDAIAGAIPIEGQSNITASLSADVPVSATVAGQSAIVADATAAAPISAAIAGQSAITATGDRIRTLSTTITGQSSTTAAATITAGVEAQVDGQSSVAGFLSATVPIFTTVTGTLGIVADASALVPAATTITGLSGATATVTRAQPAAAQVDGQSALVADFRPRAPVEAAITAQSALVAAASANVRPVATIAAQSDITARPTFPGVKKTVTVGGMVRWLATVGGRLVR